MSNYLKTSRTKALSILLAFAVAVGFMFVVNTDRSYADDTELDSVNLTIEIPKCGTVIEGIDSVTQDPMPNVSIKDTDPKYSIWYCLWSPDEDGGYFEGCTVKGETPLYVSIGLNAQDGYVWKNEPNSQYQYTYDFKGDINIENAESIGEAFVSGDTSLHMIFKIMPKHEWDEGKVTKEPTATEEGVKTYTCIGGCTRTEPIPKTGPTPAPTVDNSGFLLAQMTSKGSTSMNIGWTKVNGAAGYDIFLSKCNKGGNTYTPELVKTVEGNATTKWTKTGLNKKTAYKAYVQAYVMKDGQKSYVATSPYIHAFTSNGDKSFTNAKSVKVKKSKVSLKAGKTFKIKASVKKAKSGKKLIDKTHAAKLRYYSNNEGIAKVSSKGKITAVAKGSCKVYAIAPNGVKKAVKVTVK